LEANVLSVDGITTGFKDVAILCPLGAFCAKNVALPVSWLTGTMGMAQADA